MKKIFVLFISCLFIMPIMAQDSISIMRKGARIVGQDGEKLTRQELQGMLDVSSYDLYNAGHYKMVSSIPLYVISASSLLIFGEIEMEAIQQKKVWDDYWDSYDPQDPNQTERLLVPPQLVSLIGLVPLAVTVSTGLWAIKRTNNGKQMINGVCDVWNSGKIKDNNNLSLSLVSTPCSIGLTLNF